MLQQQKSRIFPNKYAGAEACLLGLETFPLQVKNNCPHLQEALIRGLPFSSKNSLIS